MRRTSAIASAGAVSFQNFLRFLFAPESTNHVDCHREARETIAQGLQVLKRQYGRGRQERHLLGVHDRLEGGTHRHFGLAVSNVPT
jgi:hypothetical protein